MGIKKQERRAKRVGEHGGDNEVTQAGSRSSGYTIIPTVETKHLITILTFGLKDTWGRLRCGGGRTRRNGVWC